MKDVKLTAKQIRFCEEYIIDLNAGAAAIRAGYSEKTAYEIGYENLRKPQIAEFIQRLKDERSKRTEITADRVLQELAKIGFADIKSYVSFKTALTRIGYDKEGDEIIDYATVVELKDSEEVDGAAISEVSLKDGSLKFKLHDKKGALDSMARHLGMFNDKVKVDVEGEINHEHNHKVDSGTINGISESIARIATKGIPQGTRKE